MNDPLQTADGTSRICPWWLIHTFDNPIRKIFQKPREILGPFVASGSRCLDVGCGIGYFTIPMAELAGASGSATGVDIQPRMLRGTERRAERRGVAGRVQLRTPDAMDWETPAQYDFALLFWMLHEVPDQNELLRQVRGVLKPAGKVLLVEPKGHVRTAGWQRSLELAATLRFAIAPAPAVAFSRSAILSPA